MMREGEGFPSPFVVQLNRTHVGEVCSLPDSLVTLGGMVLASIPVLLISCVAVALLQVYLTRERVQLLLGAGGARGYLVAVAVGIITPFSAASGLPLAAGLLEAGVPLGVVTTFLVVCPFVSPVPILTISSGMGWMAGFVYFAGVSILGVAAGLLLDRLGMAHLLPQATLAALTASEVEPPDTGKALTVLQRAWSMILRVTPYLVAGLALAALAYRFLPGELLARYVGDGSWWSLPVAVLLGVPVINLVPVLFPMSLVLVHKGVALGVVLTFSMAAAGLKLPESIFLARLLGPRVLAYLLGVVATGALGAGIIAERLGG
jgi:uncharacterized protein